MRGFAFVICWAAWAGIGLSQIQSPLPQETPKPHISYHLESVAGGIRGLQQRYSYSALLLLQKLNRRDLQYLARLKEMVVPDQWFYNELYFSPLPDSYEWAAEYDKMIIVHREIQVFGAYERGQLVRWGPVSTGRKPSPTPAGLYNLKWKAKIWYSTDNQEWRMPWYFNFINFRGLGFHQYEMPGFPASHSCVRLLEEDAEWLYNWGEQWKLDANGEVVLQKGTPVLIIGEFDYQAPPPWRNPEKISSRIALPADPIPAVEPAVKP